MFPDEILTNILFRLPVKFILRFRSVSKSWLALLDSSYFVKLHLNRSVQTRTNLALFFISHPGRELFKVALDSIEEDCVIQPVEDDVPPVEDDDRYNNLPRDSCHGLLCMTDGTSKAVLWNPSTRKYIQLPYAPLIEIDTIEDDNDDLNLHFIFRICYDKTNDDYKVVRLSTLQNDSFDVIDFEVNIYSLKSNSWHKLENCLHYPNFDGTEAPIAIAGGALHWISDGISDSVKESLIVAFNLGTNTYRVIPKPEFGGLDQLRYLHLHNLGETLSLSFQYESMSVDIFLLKEYDGNNEYWSKLVTISPTMSFAPLFCVRPVSYSKSGKRVLLEVDDEKLIWYNLEHESF